ncbi:NAD(P)H-hydrate dehydratase [Patescibacteria group bacterium]|nr:NAD(P)H-hydrate dehydratase [Patescibacteria group bacterium]
MNLSSSKKTILYDQNAIYYGFSIEKLMERAGQGIAKIILKKYGRHKKIGFFCGPGNNGGDGFAAARHLSASCRPEVYLIPSAEKIRTKESQKNWKLFKGQKQDNVKAKDIPDNFDAVVECLFGAGLSGKVKEPYALVIKKLNQLKGKKVTIDLPAPGFKPQLCISLMFPKSPQAEAVDIGYPKWLAEKIGVGQIKVLHRPLPDSHKGDNGKLLIIGGSRQYHGAPLLAAKVASKIVDLVYFSSIPENNELIKKMKSKLCEFMAVPRESVLNQAGKVDAVLIGPGLGVSQESKALVNNLLKKYPKKKFILDADSLRVVDKKLLNKNCLVTPHHQEFKILFGQSASKQSIRQMSKKYGCVIVLKGQTDFVASPQEFKINETGNAGMTKGGTGDVLAGLIASFACKNDLFLAACAGVFINGLAGDRLYNKVGNIYNASDLIKEIPLAVKWSLDF